MLASFSTGQRTALLFGIRELNIPKYAPVSILAVLGGLLYLGSELYFSSGQLGFPLDDSWIHLQFARQLADAEGLAYNSGHWVTGSTAPLWTALLSVGFMLPGALFLLWPKLLGLIFFVTTVMGAVRLAKALGAEDRTATIAGAVVATNHWLVWSSMSGMEVLLFTSLALWGIVAHIHERATTTDESSAPVPISIALLAAACLARPEGALILVLALCDRLFVLEASSSSGDSEALGASFRLPRDFGRVAFICAVILLPTLAFYFFVGGSLLPTTFGAKARPDLDLWPSLSYLRLVIDIFFRSEPILVLTAAAGISSLVAPGRVLRTEALLPAAWLLGQSLVYSILASEGSAPPVGNFGRYFFPLLPVVAVLGLVGLEPLFRRASSGLHALGRRWSLLPLVLVLLFLPRAFGLFEGTLRYARTVGNVNDSDVRAALWLRERLPPEALLAVQDAGALKFFLPNSIIDLAGIVNPEIRPALLGTSEDPRYSAEIYWEERLVRYLGDSAPADYLVVFSASYPALGRGSANGFERVMTFEIEDNLAMAGDELVILSTPWTRHPLKLVPGDDHPRTGPAPPR